MRRVFFFMYAAICYFVFFVTFCYLIGFVSNVFVPKSIDSAPGEKEVPILVGILINLWLLSLFGIQHSVMARQEFKKKWTKVIPEPIERSTYVLFASAAIILLLYFWQPIPYVIWNVTGSAGGYILLGVSFLGWGLVLLSTFLLNHFHLFGVNQAYDHLKNKEQKTLQFRTPLIYKLVRHPLYLGFLIAFWFAPVMSAGHLFFTVIMTIYVFIGIHHEEKDLVKTYGTKYEQYRRNTPKILPYSKS